MLQRLTIKISRPPQACSGRCVACLGAASGTLRTAKPEPS